MATDDEILKQRLPPKLREKFDAILDKKEDAKQKAQEKQRRVRRAGK